MRWGDEQVSLSASGRLELFITEHKLEASSHLMIKMRAEFDEQDEQDIAVLMCQAGRQ